MIDLLPYFLKAAALASTPLITPQTEAVIAPSTLAYVSSADFIISYVDTPFFESEDFPRPVGYGATRIRDTRVCGITIPDPIQEYETKATYHSSLFTANSPRIFEHSAEYPGLVSDSIALSLMHEDHHCEDLSWIMGPYPRYWATEYSADNGAIETYYNAYQNYDVSNAEVPYAWRTSRSLDDLLYRQPHQMTALAVLPGEKDIMLHYGSHAEIEDEIETARDAIIYEIGSYRAPSQADIVEALNWTNNVFFASRIRRGEPIILSDQLPDGVKDFYKDRIVYETGLRVMFDDAGEFYTAVSRMYAKGDFSHSIIQQRSCDRH